jgi:glycosyltransferase involved in cell wall biosynthesis
MKNGLKISIIVPVYDVEPYLEKCLDSCVSQTFDDIEIIVINDASPDNSEKIMRRYAERYPRKIKCIYLEQNVGLGAARNIGIRESRGEYLMFVDSDDWVDESICEKMYNEAQANKSELVYCNCFIVSETGTQYYRRVPRSFKKTTAANVATEACACIVCKDMMTENDLYFPEGILFEDMAITTLWFLHANGVSGVKEALYYYLRRENSITNTATPENYISFFTACICLFEKAKSTGKYGKYKNLIDFKIINHVGALLGKWFTHCDIDRRPAYLKFSQLLKLINPDFENNEQLIRCFTSAFIAVVEDLYASPEKEYKSYEDVSCKLFTERYLSGRARYKVFNAEFLKIREYLNTNKLGGLAVWGAGKNGKAILCVLNELNIQAFAVDRNPALYGALLPSGHTVRSFTEVYDKIYAIIVSGSIFFNEVKEYVGVYGEYLLIDINACILEYITIDELL